MTSERIGVAALWASAAFAAAACSAAGPAAGWAAPHGDGGAGAQSASGDDAGDPASDDASAGGDGASQPPKGHDASAPQGTPPFGGSSGGSGGSLSGGVVQTGGVTYRLVVPGSYASAPTPLLIVYSGTEGGAQMTTNLENLGSYTGTDDMLRAVLDGVDYYYDDGTAGAVVLDDVRAKFNVDNDRTYLLGESAGTMAALAFGFHKRQSYFAAYWANDVNASDSPGSSAGALGFAPWGQAGPGGDYPDAQTIVGGMQSAGYRLPSPAPYAGAGSDTHGASDQFHAALGWFPGKSRK